MKKIILLPALLLLTSCSTAAYFQVYKTVPTDNKISKIENNLVYEDENCVISYNFWDEGGDFGFKFYNKTDKKIFIDLSDSYFILNGISNNYFKDRIYSFSSSSGFSTSSVASSTKSVSGANRSNFLQTNRVSLANASGFMSSNGYSVSYNEERIIVVPAKTSKIISEFKINNTLFRYCDLLKYPSRKEVKTKSFDKETSPLVFSNLITYSIEGNDNKKSIQNEFYISEVTNLPETEMFYREYEEFCGKRGSAIKKVFKGVASDKFYTIYSKGFDGLKN